MLKLCKARLEQDSGYASYSMKVQIIIVTRNGQSGNTGHLNRDLYVMLKFTKRSKNTGDAFKKNIAFPEGNKLFAGDFVLIWMK